METGEIMKKLLLILFSLIILVNAQQVGYVEYNHKVYKYLDRLETQHLLDNYDSFEIPKSRKEISTYLQQLIKKRNKLNLIDQQILGDLLIEFEYDIKGTAENYSSFYDDKFNTLFNEKEKFLYYSTDSSKASIFVNLVTNVTSLYENDRNADLTESSNLVQYGGILRGTILNNFGFMIKGTNGTYFGDKSLVLKNTPLKYNYKFSSDPSEQTATDFFDETEGYFMGEFENFRFKLGRDRSILGYGINKIILGQNTPPMDYFSINFNYKSFNYSFYHGKLLGTAKESVLREDLIDKYFVYHRFSIDFGKHFNLGIGEMVVYADRGIDLSYLNPFNFYKSVEHLNQDRDNTILFLDFENRSIRGLKFYGSLLIDDIDFGKIGNGWYGNKTLVSIGAHSTNLYHLFPLDVSIEYSRVQPYVFTHRFYKNNYTSLNYSLVDPIEPNSDIFTTKLNYIFSNRINFSLEYVYKRHGLNVYDENGNLIKNVGGDILAGHRIEDAEHLNFLDGDKETTNLINFNATIEPFRNYFILLDIVLQKTTVKDKITEKTVGSQLKFMVRI